MKVEIVWYKCQVCEKLFQSISYLCGKAACDYCGGTGIRLDDVPERVKGDAVLGILGLG